MNSLPRCEVLDVFDGTVFIIGSIDAALVQARAALTAAATARMDRSLLGMQRANTELHNLLRQSTILSESLGRVLRFHAEREDLRSCRK